MQPKTFLALFCTIATVLIGVNDGAPTTKAAKPAKTTVSLVTDPPAVVLSSPSSKPVPGKRTDWKTKVDAKSKKLFNDYKKIIVKKLGTVHKVPATFKPKPEKVSTQVVSGILYHYLVRLPSKQYAHVTILERQWLKDQYGKEEHVTVRPDLYPLDAKNI